MDWLTICIIIVCLILVFAIGAQDESMAAVYGSGSLPLRYAVIIGGILSFFGVLLLSQGVSETIGTDLLGENVEYDNSVILAILMGTAAWLLLAAKTGVPISTTHSVVGAVFGISVIWAITYQQNYFDCVNWIEMAYVFLGWVLSPIFGYFGAMGGQKLINIIIAKKSGSLLQVEHTEKIFRNIIIIFACVNQMSRGGNDSGNAVGIFYSLLKSNQINQSDLQIIILLAGVFFSAGLILIGKNLVKMVGSTTGQLRPSEALAVEGTTAIVILTATLLNIPVSGGHILIFALIGSARMKGEHPDQRSFRRMVRSWMLTFPVAALFSAVSFAILTLFK